jgi:outer membrane receptor protein involved in Fe transport
MRDPAFYDRDTFNLDRIEVMRGSASMLFGRGSTGGVINQVTKKPMLIDQSDVMGTVGSRGYYRTTATSTSAPTKAALRMNVMVNKADNGGAKIDKYGFAPTYSWGIGSRDEFTVGLSYRTWTTCRWRPSATWVAPCRTSSRAISTAPTAITSKARPPSTRLRGSTGSMMAASSRPRCSVFDRSQWGMVAVCTTNGATTTAANLRTRPS